jgi:hypothetical protein
MKNIGKVQIPNDTFLKVFQTWFIVHWKP